MFQREGFWGTGISGLLPDGLGTQGTEGLYCGPLQVSKFDQHLAAEAFLVVLNQPQNSSEHPRARGRLRANRQVPGQAVELLRVSVDEWIDSGYIAGVDEPRKRSLERATKLAAAAHMFSKRGQILLIPSSTGDGLAAHVISRGAPERYQLAFEVQQEAFVQELLAFMLLCDFRFKLAKCRRGECNTYFLLKQWNRPYRKGTICPNCQQLSRQTRAKQIISESRKDAVKQLHQLVAKKFAKQILDRPGWQEQAKLKQHIADYLGSRIEQSHELSAIYPRGLTGKWVARPENWPVIDRLVKESIR